MENYDLDWDAEREISRDAILMDAAPDLLASLKELLFRVNRNDVWVNHSNPAEAMMRKGVVARARAAIAKAEGK